MWPALLNVCGYLLPVVVVFRKRLRPLRFANYLYILPLWFAIMFYKGLIVETRIYGELCPFTAIAVVLLIEDHVRRRGSTCQAINEAQVRSTVVQSS